MSGSYVTCPCGFRSDGFAADAMAAYRAHQCTYHDAEPEPEERESGWPGTVEWVALLVAVVLLCLICAGVINR